MLEIKNLWKGYNRTKVIKGVNLTVEKGEIHGLIGENSAGKTTLIKCAAGVYKPDEGEILYDGEPIYDNPSVKEKVGYVADSNEYISLYNLLHNSFHLYLILLDIVYQFYFLLLLMYLLLYILFLSYSLFQRLFLNHLNILILLFLIFQILPYL